MNTLPKSEKTRTQPSRQTEKKSAPAVGKLALKYLHEWATGKQPSADAYLGKLPDEKSRDDFKQAVGMGKLLRQTLA